MMTGAVAVLSLTGAWLVPTASFGTAGPNASARPAQGRDPNPGSLTNPCLPSAKGVRWGTDRNDKSLKDRAPGDIICARKGNDSIVVQYPGTIVWSGPGNDSIKMKNRLPNELRAGTGRDSARADPVTTDRWYNDLEVAPYGSKAVRQAAAPAARAARAAFSYPAREPRIHCVIEGGQRKLLIEPAPEMRAVDVTGRVDWQFVAWSPVLSVWNPQTQAWEFVVQNEWLWDRTYDEQVEVFQGNVWRRFTAAGEKWRLWFYANRPGFFRVAAYYFHYASGSVPANRVYDWVDQHRGQFAASHGQWCHFTV